MIATYNRARVIRKTLKCLADQTLDPAAFEVVLVDDGSPDDTESVVCAMKPYLPFAFQDLKHPNRGIGYTENRGIRAAKAPLICLIADDIHFTPKALEAHLEIHKDNPEEQVAVLGKVIQDSGNEPTVFLKKWDPFRFRELSGLRDLPYYLFWTCNVSAKKSFLLKAGLVNEKLTAGGAYAHEDVEFGYRLWKNGLVLRFSEEALAFHHHIVSLEQALRKAQLGGRKWVDFRRTVDMPELTVRYHVLSPPFLKDYVTTFRQERNNLLGSDRNPAQLFLLQLLRVTAFNRMTVPAFWLPLLNLAEKSPTLARLMNRTFYRCTVSHFFHKGVWNACSEGRSACLQGLSQK